MRGLADFFTNQLEPYCQTYPDPKSFPPDPEQTFFLGNRYADYALAFGFAILFPLLRSLLRTLLYEVSSS
jgi:hypothetical protein